MKANIQFIRGLDEKIVPDVRLTRSRDGSTGTATFRFKNPNILDKNVPDPYYGDISDFENVYNIVDKTCDIIASTLEE